MINNLGQTAIAGLQRSQQGIARSAADIASASNSDAPDKLTRAIVDMHEHENAAKANVKTLQAHDQMLGSLLDVKA